MLAHVPGADSEEHAPGLSGRAPRIRASLPLSSLGVARQSGKVMRC